MFAIALMSAPAVIQFHASLAILACALGPLALLRKQRDWVHRCVGYVWVLAMLGTAISSLFISENPMLGPFSPIHVLSFITLGGLAFALRAAIKGNVIAHGRTMRALYVQALIIPGVFTFLPGRRMNAVFGLGENWMVFAGAAIIGTLVIAAIWFHPALARAVRLNGKGSRRIPLFFSRPTL